MASFSSSGRAISVSQPGEDVEHEAGLEVEAHAEAVGQGQGDDPATVVGGVVAGRELVVDELLVLAVHLDEVPVERPVGERGSWSAIRSIDVVAQLADLRDELERGARELADDGAQREQLLAAGDPVTAPARPWWSLCDVDHVEENPRPPARRPSRRRSFICSSSAGVASRSVAASFITTRRIAEWPTRKPAFGSERAVEPVEVLGRRASSPTARRAAATRAACPRPGRACASGSRRPRRVSGAIVKPQLPPITVVTPWSGDGDSVVSQKAWAS